MTPGILAIRYARALIAIAQESNQYDTFKSELETFLTILREESTATLLTQKGLSPAHKMKILEDILSACSFTVDINHFIKLLAKKNRLVFLPEIFIEYIKMVDQVLRRCPMTVVSAVNLSDKQYQEIETFFAQKTGQKIILDKKIDPTVLGGLKIRVGDKIYDTTLKRQLEILSQK